MLTYTSSFADIIIDAEKEALDTCKSMDLTGLIAFAAVLQDKDFHWFDKAFNEHVKRFEKDVAPTYASPQIYPRQPTNTGSIGKIRCVTIVRWAIGSELYRVQCRETRVTRTTINGVFESKEEIARHPPEILNRSFEFIDWASMDGDEIITPNPRQFTKLPTGTPTPESRVAQ